MMCKGCFKNISSGMYCSKCKSEMFAGVNVKPLNFDKEEFYKVHTEMADRLSISGVQDKISLKLFGDKLEPTATDGKYILKPVPASNNLKHKEDIAANEHVSMQISKQIFGINTAASALIPFKDGELAYVTKRFDYAKDGIKLDQEDFASVLESTEDTKGRNYKYESSYEEVADAIKKYVPAAQLTLEDFYLRIVFNYLIANGDAHLKNFSLYRPENRKDYALTPSYDLVYTRYHVNETEGDMGLDLFKNTDTRSYGALGFYSLEDFEEFARMIELPEKRLVKIFRKIITSTPKVTEMVEKSFLSDSGKEAYLDSYQNRLKQRLFYVIGENYAYDSVLLPIVESALEDL